MISFLSGIIEEKQEGTLIMDVGGVGYEVSISNNTLVSLPHAGERAKVLTYMAVREDGIFLFGFSTSEERDLFMKLITVSGVGPKLAITILSGLKLSDLTIAIKKEDVKLLSTIKGLGKKTAERVCLELKDKLDLFATQDAQIENIDEDAVQMAADTLVALGISKNEAYMLARANAKEGNSVEDIIAKSLRGYRS